MIENLLVDLIKPIKALKLLTIFLEEQVTDESVFYINKNQYDKKENTLVINYAISLVNNDISKIRKKYYKLMSREKYRK